MQVKLTMESCTNVCRIVNTKLQPSLCLWGPAFQCMRPYPTSVKDSYVLETTYKFGSLSHLCSFGPIPSQWYASLHFSAGLFCPSSCPLYGKREACFILCQIESNRSLYVLVQSSLLAFARFDEEQVPSSSICRNLTVGIVGRRQQYIFHVFLCHPSGFFQDGKSIRGTFIIGLVPIDTRNSFVKTSNSSWRASWLILAVGARATESTGLLHIGKI